MNQTQRHRWRWSRRWSAGLLLALSLALGGWFTAGAVAGDGTGYGGTAPPSVTPSQDGAVAVPGEVLVRVRAGTAQAKMAALADTLGSATVRDLNVGAILPPGQRILLVKSDELEGAALVQAARANVDVLDASLNYIRQVAAITPNDPRYAQQWALNNTGQGGGTAGADVSAPEAWSVTTGSSGTVVADLDTGVAWNHKDLAANMWRNPGEIAPNGVDDDHNGFVDDVYGIDTINNDSDPYDDDGHGTHTAGTIAAQGNNGIGVTGVSWRTRIMALKVLNAKGFLSDAGAIKAINYVVYEKRYHGVNVVAINASWGGGGNNTLMRDAINAAGQANIVFCAAAGNGGRDQIGDDNDAFPFYPASFDCANIIAVAATDNRDAKAGFSNYGKTSVDLAAPGVSVLSTIPGGFNILPSMPFYDDMEAGGGAWTAQSPWQVTTELAMSGLRSWSDSPGGNYANNRNAAITTRLIDLRATPGPDAFGFKLQGQIEVGHDALWVEFSNNGGATWRTMGKLSGRWNDWTQTYFWIPADMRVANFRARLRMVTDASVTYDGVHVDNVGFGDVAPSPPDTYASIGGTSMATPHVAGAVALRAAAFPTETAAQRKQRVLAGVDAIAAMTGRCVTGGRLNLSKVVTPVLIISSPSAATIWREGTAQPITWTVRPTVQSGEFRVVVRNAAGATYLNKVVLVVPGRAGYSTTSPVTAPPGSGYRAYVYWRPTVGVGGWSAAVGSQPFAVSAPTIAVASPTSASSWPSGSAQTVSWTVSPALAVGEFRVLLRQAGGPWYVNQVQLVQSGVSGYSKSVTINAPAGTGYRAYVSWRPVIGSGTWDAVGSSPEFTVTPINITNPTASSSWPSGSKQTVTWTVNPAYSTGEFRVLLRSAAGTYYANEVVLAVSGRQSYAKAITVAAPAGSGYRAIVAWRPVVGSGSWVVIAQSAAFTVTPINITSPTASSSWPSGSRQTVTWTVNPAFQTGEFYVYLRSAGGTWYNLGRVLVTAGRTAYGATIRVTPPAGSNYRAYVYYRPVVGSGGWTAGGLSGPFTVTP